MASIDAGAEGGGIAMPQEGRGGGRMAGSNNTNSNSNNNSNNSNKKKSIVSSDVESDNLYSVLGLPVGSTAAQIKVQTVDKSLLVRTKGRLFRGVCFCPNFPDFRVAFSCFFFVFHYFPGFIP